MGIVIGDGLGLLQVLVARYLGVELLGLFSLDFAAFHLGTVVAVQGMGQGVVRYVMSPSTGREEIREGEKERYTSLPRSPWGGRHRGWSVLACSLHRRASWRHDQHEWAIQDHKLCNSILLLLLQTGLRFLWILRYGILGAALASAISSTLMNVLQLLQVQFMLGMHPFRIGFLKPLAAGCGAWLVLRLAQVCIPEAGNSVLRLVLSLSIFMAVYGLALYGLGFDNEDKVILQRIKARLA